MARKSTKVTSPQAVNGHTTSAEKRSIGVDFEGEKPAKRTKLPSKTDYSRWRLLDEKGRQTWHYLEDDEEVKKWPQTTADKYFLGLPTVRIDQSSLLRKLTNCLLESTKASNSQNSTGCRQKWP
jgi:lanosterol synthase